MPRPALTEVTELGYLSQSAGLVLAMSNELADPDSVGGIHLTQLWDVSRTNTSVNAVPWAMSSDKEHA
jgi:hypothetical protein